MRFLVPIVCGAALYSLCAVSQAQVEQPKIREFDIATLEKLGRDIYLQDQEAWKATDILFAAHPQTELEKEKLTGWIVDSDPQGDRVRFVRGGEAGPEAAYDISFKAGAEPQLSVPEDRNLTSGEKSLFAARMLVAQSIPRPCSEHYNIVTLKDPQGNGLLVWALAGTTDPEAVLLGGHYRFTLSPEGNKIISRDALSRSCMALKNGRDTVMLATTQLVSDIPVETIVWQNLLIKKPIMVLTPDHTEWIVSEGKLENRGPMPPKP